MSLKKLKLVWLFLIFGILGVNFLAFMQAYKMLHYSSSGTRTEKPENMNFFEKILVLFTGVNLPKPVNGVTPADFGLDFKTYNYKNDCAQNLSAWYVPPSHKRRIIIFFHGHAASKSQMLPEAKACGEQGYGLFLVDFRGCGNSDGYKTSLGYDEANDVRATVQFVRGKWPDQKIVLVGQSMGSAAILHAFSRGPLPVDRIILGCPFDSLFNTVKNRFSIMRLPSFPLAHLLMFWGSLQLGYDGFNFRPSDDAKAVHCPALLLFGELDRNVLPAESNSVFENLGGVKRSKEFLGCGHESFVKKDPSQWKKSVFDFLNQN